MPVSVHPAPDILGFYPWFLKLLRNNIENVQLEWALACGIRVEFVKESLAFTCEDSPMANLMLSVTGAFAEFERELIRERQLEGIALAKQRGAYKGRKKALSLKQADTLRQQVKDGQPKAQVAREYGISRETLYQ
jgi:DNA invertase Pin-like site-specific DNA recombinase